jgi:hypothetical protein
LPKEIFKGKNENGEIKKRGRRTWVKHTFKINRKTEP